MQKKAQNGKKKCCKLSNQIFKNYEFKTKG